jgi:hypothetical protein
MKFRLFVVAVVVAMTGLTAHAQVGLYFNPVISRISNSVADSGPFAFLGQNEKSQIFGGVDFGGYWEFKHLASADVSIDMRDTIQHGDSSSINSFLMGLRLSAKPLKFSMKPYVELGVGDGRTRAALSIVHVNKFEYNVMGGIDRPLNKHIDWRVVEVGYGTVKTMSSEIYGGPVTIPAAKLLNFSTGFVFRIR